MFPIYIEAPEVFPTNQEHKTYPQTSQVSPVSSIYIIITYHDSRSVYEYLVPNIKCKKVNTELAPNLQLTRPLEDKENHEIRHHIETKLNQQDKEKEKTYQQVKTNQRLKEHQPFSKDKNIPCSNIMRQHVTRQHKSTETQHFKRTKQRIP